MTSVSNFIFKVYKPTQLYNSLSSVEPRVEHEDLYNKEPLGI